MPSISISPSSSPSTSPPFETQVVRGENGAVGKLSRCRDVPTESTGAGSSNGTGGSSAEVTFRYIVFVQKFADDIDGVMISLETTIHSTFTENFLDCEFRETGLRRYMSDELDLDLKSVSSLPQAKLSVPTNCPQEMLRKGTDCYIVDDAITVDSTKLLANKTVITAFNDFFNEEMGPEGSLGASHPDIVDLGFYLEMTAANVTTRSNSINNEDKQDTNESDNVEPPSAINTDPESVSGSNEARVLGPTLIAGATTGLVLVGLLAYTKKNTSSQESYMEYSEDMEEFTDEQREMPLDAENDQFDASSSIWQFSVNSEGVEVSNKETLQREALGALDAPDDEHHCMSDACIICNDSRYTPRIESQKAAIEVVRSMSYRRSLPRSPRSYECTDTVNL